MKPLLTVACALFVAFGIGFVFMPDFVLGMYGVDLNPDGVRITRMFGAAVLGQAAFCQAARTAAPEQQRRAVAACVVFFVVKSLVTFEAVAGGMFNAWGWSILGIDIPMACASAAVWWTARPPRAAAQPSR